jgi:hypothetical protein
LSLCKGPPGNRAGSIKTTVMRGSGGRIHIRTVATEHRVETLKVNAAGWFKLRQYLDFLTISGARLSRARHVRDLRRPGNRHWSGFR